MKNRYIPQYQPNKYRVSPYVYNDYLLYSLLNSSSRAALAGMDYGCYMDMGDGLGYDEIAGYDYGYDGALAGIIDTILNVGSFIGKMGVTAYKFAAPYVTSAYKFAVKLPSIAVKAAGYIYEGGKWVYKSVISPTYKGVIRPVASWTGKAAISAIGAAGSIFTGSQGQAAPAAQPVQYVEPPAAGAPQGGDYVQPPQAQDSSQYLPSDVSQGFVYNPATGAVEPMPANGEQAPASGAQAGGKNLLWYIIGGVAIIAAIL